MIFRGVITTVVAAAALSTGMAQAAPVEVVHTSALAPSVEPDRILYRNGQTMVVKDEEATPADFENLYLVHTPNWFTMPPAVRDAGELVDFSPSKFAVMKLRGEEVPMVSSALHGEGLACGVMIKLSGEPIAEKEASTPEPQIPVTTRRAKVAETVSLVEKAKIRALVEEMAAMDTRYHSAPEGQGVAAMLAEKYEALATGRDDVTIETYDHGSETSQKSLVVRIEGQEKPEEILVLGSHIDSINARGGRGSRAPGADDNASGTATNLEIFRRLMEQDIRLERTLEIHGYAAEEVGLVGSQDIAGDYRDADKDVVAMVQHDMNLYRPDGQGDKIWFVSNNTNDGFNDLLSQLVDGYVQMDWGMKSLFGGTSDHASWDRAGYAAAFPFENPRRYNDQIHTRHDTIDNSGSFSQAAGFAKLGIAYAMHFGGIAE